GGSELGGKDQPALLLRIPGDLRLKYGSPDVFDSGKERIKGKGPGKGCSRCGVDLEEPVDTLHHIGRVDPKRRVRPHGGSAVGELEAIEVVENGGEQRTAQEVGARPTSGRPFGQCLPLDLGHTP